MDLQDGISTEGVSAGLDREGRDVLCDGLRRLLADHGTEADVRRAMQTPTGYEPDLWRRLCEMGLSGLIVDETHGGSGAGPVDLEAVTEVAGAALLCSPLLAQVLAAALLNAVGDTAANARLLPGIADGSRIVATALTGDAGTWTPEGVAVTATAEGERWTLNGAASYVLHGQNAETLLVLARTGDGLALFEVDAAVAGVAVAALPTFDHTLRLARVAFDGAEARRLAVRGAVWPAVQAALDVALVALAGEQAGGARRVLDFTVDYAKTRHQFGRPIGGFQAVKHMAADLLLEAESATSAACEAAARLAAGGADATAAVALAAFACADAYVAVAATAIQMHGGVAFTWDHPAHLYLRRARSGAALFGASTAHRERYLTALGAEV